MVPKESFFVVSDAVPILYNKPWINSITCARFIVKNWDNIWCNLMHLKKKCNGIQIRAFKIFYKWTAVYKDYWRWKVYILYKCSYSNWKIVYPRQKYHLCLKVKVHIWKFHWFFWFLIMIFYFFYYQLWAKWVCIHIGSSYGHIGQTYLRFLKHLWMFDPESNAHQIDILDNLFD